MAYLTAQEFIDRFDQGEMDALVKGLPVDDADEKIIAAIADAEGFVNGYLNKRYSTPIANSTSMLKRCVAALARYYMYDNHTPERVRVSYEDQVSFLKDVAAGKADLAGATDESVLVSGSSSGGSMVSSPVSKLNLEAY